MIDSTVHTVDVLGVKKMSDLFKDLKRYGNFGFRKIVLLSDVRKDFGDDYITDDEMKEAQDGDYGIFGTYAVLDDCGALN